MAPTFLTYKNDKLQRIGLLKILVAILDPQRRSVTSDSINRKLSELLYQGGSSETFRAESLIREADCSSWILAITKNQVGQVLEWGRLYGLVGSGNQITEKGLLLRHLIGEDAIQSIIRGDFFINPFRLSSVERFYILYINMEMDAVLYFLFKRLSEESGESYIGGVQAGKITCFALYDAYKMISSLVGSSGNLLPLRNMRELLGRIVAELGLSSDIPVQPIMRPRISNIARQKPEQRNKKRTKTADHEAIPRFELLTDLGFLTKNMDIENSNGSEKSRKSWRYWVTPWLKTFSEALPDSFDEAFCWRHFAQTATVLLGNQAKKVSTKSDPMLIAQKSYDAYTEVKRVFGHTPIESVANIAMIRSLVRSEILEMKDVHELFLSFKRDNLFSETLRFAAGNALDQMFIDIKPSFLTEVEEYYGKHNGNLNETVN